MHITEKQHQKIDGLLAILREYLQVRFEHACRVNPNLRRMAEDLTWQQLATVRQIFAETKAFGPERYCVIDILTSFDARKKGALFSLTDQNTIFNEIVSEVGREKAQKKMEDVTITDLGSFYKTIDPATEDAVLLIQSWIWWDLPDALDLQVLDLQLERIKALSQSEMSPELLGFYRNETHDATADLNIADIVQFEVKRSREAAHAFTSRREHEPAFKAVVKRVPQPDTAIDAAILTMAQRLRVAEQVQKSGELDDTLRAHYGKVLHCAPEDVAAERVVALEREALANGRQQLRRMLESDGAGGEMFNFKLRQVEQVKEKLARIEAAAKAVAEKAGPSAGASV